MALPNLNYLIIEETIKFVQNTVLDAVDVKYGGMIEIANGVTLTINGPFTDNGLQRQIFSGAGSVLFARGSVPLVNVMWFGPDPNRGHPDATTRAFQAALDSSHAIGEVFVPAGYYQINDTLHIGRKTIKGFHSTWFHGPTNGSSTGFGVRLFVDFDDRPGINIEAARGTKISNIDITGTNEKPGVVYKIHAQDPYDWVDKPAMLERFDSYCGICTDQFGLVDDQGGTHAASAHVAIEDCYIRGFGVGVVISRKGIYQNDTIKVNRCTIEECAYGIAVGTSQARTCRFVDNRIGRCHTVFDNLTFGEETASSTFNTDSNQIANCRNIYNIATTKGGQCVLSGDYAEATGKIGTFGKPDGHSSGQGVLLQGGYYSINFWEDLPMTLAADCALTFNRCTIRLHSEISRDWYINPRVPTAQIVFDNCIFECNGTEVEPRIFFRLYHEHNVHFRECRIQPYGGIVRQPLSNHMSIGTSLSEPERLKLYLHTQLVSVHRFSGPNATYLVEEAVPLPVSMHIENIDYQKDVAGFDLRINTESDNINRDELIESFKDEFGPIPDKEYEKNINTNVILAVDVANKTSPDWIIAGFNDAGQFIQLSIDDASHELAVALNEENPKNLQTLELLTDALGSSFDISVVSFTPKEKPQIVTVGDLLYWEIFDSENDQIRREGEEQEHKKKIKTVLPILEVRSIEESGKVIAVVPSWMRKEIKLNRDYNHKDVVKIWSEPWAVLSGEITGDVTAKSQDILNVQNAQLLKAGDFLAGVGIPSRARVLEINASIVTLNLAATATQKGVSLNNAILRAGK